MEEQLKILIAEPMDFSPEVIKRLRKYAQVDVYAVEESDLEQVLQEYDVFWFRLGWKINRSVLNEKSRCKILATPVTGIDHIDENLCRELGVKIVCLRGEKEFLREVRATAEMTLALALAVMRHIPAAEQSVRDGVWNRDLFRGNELHLKTAGIVGFGRLGEIVADMFLAFGMKVLAYDVKPGLSHPGVQFTDTMEELVSLSDVVSIHVIYNESTHHIINEDVLKHSKKGAYLINTSRGGIVDEEAMLKALKEGWLKGAALDVLQGEHDISDAHPLIQYAKENRNLLIVPHIGGNTYESFEKTEHFIAGKIIEIIQSKAIENATVVA